MKLIKLTQGKFAQVDDWNYDELNGFKWYAHKHKNTYYAERNEMGKSILMHRVIMDTPDNMQVDHKDHNGLNCQEFNMRNCTHRQNGMNVIPRGKSKFKGVFIAYYKEKQYFQTRIKINSNQIYLGSFKTEEDAARKYDEYAKIYHGEFANLNFKDQ